MARKKACKRCRMLIDSGDCPLCKINQTTNVWHGRLYILDPKKSQIAEKCGFEAKGEYAIKVR